MNMIHRIRLLMDGNKYCTRFVKMIQSTEIMKRRTGAFMLQQAKEEDTPAFQACYQENRDRFESVAALLADDFSRITLKAVIDYRLEPAIEKLGGVFVEPQYFMPDIFGPAENEVFVDGGAYVGDSILSLIQYFGKGKDYYKKVYAWEPDKANREKLNWCCRKHKNIEVLPYGMWSKKAKLPFTAGNDARCEISTEAENTQMLPVDSIDNLCGKDKVTFIKMDIEGSEIEALRGAENVIRRDKPRLAISIYHKPEHLYEIPFLVREMLPEYKLYIRHHSYSYNETVLYAVAEE